MSHLFDTNAIVYLMKLREPLASRARAADPSTLAVSTITLAELWYGGRRGGDVEGARTALAGDGARAPK